MSTKSRILLFGLTVTILASFVATSFAHRIPSMARRWPPHVRNRLTEASQRPIYVVIGEDCQVKIVADFKFRREENRGKEDKFWAGRPIRIINKSGKVVVVRFGGPGHRAWSPIGRSRLRLNPGETYATRLRSGKSSGKTPIVITCHGRYAKEESGSTEKSAGWDGPPREPDEPPPFQQGSGG